MDLLQSKQIRLEMLCEEEGRKYSLVTGGGPPSKEKLTVIEEKLLTTIDQVAVHGQKCVTESSISGDVDLDVSFNTDVMDPQDDIQNYCGRRKAVKRKIKNSLEREQQKFLKNLFVLRRKLMRTKEEWQ
ncbi:unnamed protein product [Larinioides sclopetarius]|uniref:Uncharacterized protein n=1 Tax=Larinioides sclopetarius TaxID=280406 RepID=A0AAV2AEM4_9ARAC